MSPGKNLTMPLDYMHNDGKKKKNVCKVQSREMCYCSANTKEMKKDSRLN